MSSYKRYLHKTMQKLIKKYHALNKIGRGHFEMHVLKNGSVAFQLKYHLSSFIRLQMFYKSPTSKTFILKNLNDNRVIFASFNGLTQKKYNPDTWCHNAWINLNKILHSLIKDKSFQTAFLTCVTKETFHDKWQWKIHISYVHKSAVYSYDKKE